MKISGNVYTAYYIHIFMIFLMKSPMANITALIQDQNFLQECMMTSLSRPVITSEILALREARVLCRHLLTSLSITLHMKNPKGCNLVSWEATFPSSSGPSGWPSANLGFAQQWGQPQGQNILTTHLSVILDVCLFILIKIFLIREENYMYVVWIRWFSTSAQKR